MCGVCGVISADPPNSMIIFAGFCATCRRLAAADRNPGMILPDVNRRPGRVASTMPMIATTMARMASSLLLEGSWKALPSPLPAQVKKTTIKTR